VTLQITGESTDAADASPNPAALYRLHAPDLRRLLLGLLRDQADADDALQRVFLKLLDNWNSIEPAKVKGWLFTVAYREAMTTRRRQNADAKALARLWAQPAWQQPSSAASPGEAAIRGEEIQAALSVLEALPQAQREVVRGRIFDGKTFAKLAEEFGIPLGTVLTRMRLALKTLRQLIKE